MGLNKNSISSLLKNRNSYFFNKLRPKLLKMVHINVCREIGWLLSFVYSFGQLAYQCC
jgi:hypothetical protein